MSIKFERLLGRLFDSLIESSPWESFLREMEDYLDCQSCALLLRTPTRDKSGLLISHDVGLSAPQAIFEAFQNSPLPTTPDGRIYILSKLVSGEEDNKGQGRYFETIRQVGTVDLMAVSLTDPQTSITMRFYAIRSTGSECFGDKEKAALNRLMPYLNTAVTIYSRIIYHQKQLYVSTEAASQLGIGLIALNSDGKIMMKNAVADSILKQKSDFFIRGGRLHCVDKQGEKAIRDHLRNLKEGVIDEQGADYFQLPSPEDKDPRWSVMLSPFTMPAEFNDDFPNVVSVMIRDANQGVSISIEQLKSFFSLTPAEAQLTKCLVQGESLAEAATKLNRSRSTVRVQLAAIFSKTSVHKQHQLISLVLNHVNKLRF